MIKKRLIQLSKDSMKHIKRNVFYQWLALCANIILILYLSSLIERLYDNRMSGIGVGALVMGLAVGLRFICTRAASKESFLASRDVKKILREKIYDKLLRLGPSYSERVSTAEVIQITVEGVDQLETYFGQYLPQLFYSLLAPVTLFGVLAFIYLKAALVLLLCVPLIPIAIICVQKVAKRLLGKYWGQYVKLGDSFLENLQGLTTLKIYEADAKRHQQMNEEAEQFRIVTMKVLKMQLNSIIVMDIVALGGAAAGIIIGLKAFQAGAVGIGGMFAILLLSADFFIPMRQLGSFFHVAMNGMAASDKIFRLLDLEEEMSKAKMVQEDRFDIFAENLTFAYEAERPVLDGIHFQMKPGQFTALVGKSGCGKSTIAALLCKRISGYEGNLNFGGQEICELSEEGLQEKITLVSMNSYLFGGTVRENLCMAKADAGEEELWRVLEIVQLSEFLKTQNGLDTILKEWGENFSGGQRQRLALARALLHDSPVYVFDEATSNIDVESEERIMEVIRELAKQKMVLMISHRLANTVCADQIYMLEHGKIVGSGTHEALLDSCSPYAKMWNSQKELEQYAGGKGHV